MAIVTEKSDTEPPSPDTGFRSTLTRVAKRADAFIEHAFAKVMPLVRSPWRLLVYIFINEMVCAFLYSIFEKKGIVASFWWTLVTVFTVGYGDMYPATLPGRFVGGIVMISGWLFLSLLLGHILTAFLPDPNVFTDEEQELIKDTLAKLLIFARVIRSLEGLIIYRLRRIHSDLKEIKRNQATILANQELILEHLGIAPFRPVQFVKNNDAASAKD